ncbi:TPA: heparinase II/III family protein [Bacillus cereus]|nr:heparinase II/III family protein [Bacillus cereus]
MELFKRKTPNNSTLDIAHMLLDNEIFLFKIWPSYKFGTDLTWNEDPYNDKTWRFYLHSLEMVGLLVNAYEITGESKYINKSKWYIESWIQKNFVPEKNKDEVVWSGHGAANRLINILHFWCFYKEMLDSAEKFKKEITPVLIEHGLFLMKDENYEDYNHGIFQDQALLELGVFFPELEYSGVWVNKARKRLIERFNQDVSSSGVHMEHSPSYHVVVMQLFLSIKKFMDYYKIDYPTDFVAKLSLMQDYLAYIVKKDGTIPIIGDSGHGKVLNSIAQDQILSDYWLYRVSKGKKGSIPPEKFKSYIDSGVAIYRDDVKNGKNSIYWLYSAAFNSVIHKHADDLSFVLNFGETEYFADAGKYNYKENDKYRKYFRSVFAHNSIAVDGKSYGLKKEQVGKSYIIDSGNTNEYSYVVGQHKLYPGVIITRTLIQIHDGALLIYDKILSDEVHNYTQIFNLGKDVEILARNIHKICMKNKTHSSSISLKQLLKVDSISDFYGETEPIYGWQSHDFNQKHPIQAIHFSKKGTDAEFVTLINFKGYIDIEHVEISNENGRQVYIFIDRDKNVVQKITLEEPINNIKKDIKKSDKISLNIREWELFSNNRVGYKIFRSNLNKRKVDKAYYVKFDDICLENKYANDFDSGELADIYSNGYLYISLSNTFTGWDDKQVPSGAEIVNFFSKHHVHLFYSSTLD